MKSSTFIYSCKHLSNNIARIYINNSFSLDQFGYTAGTKLSLECSKNCVLIEKSSSGSKSVIDTSRGALIELRSKDIARSFHRISKVVVTVTGELIEITPCPRELRQAQRIESLYQAVCLGKGVKYGSLFAGIGLLSLNVLNVLNGMADAGLKAVLQLANDSDPLALSCSMEGNPIWDNASPDVIASNLDVRELALTDLPRVDILEISWPCNNTSKLCPADMRDLMHPIVGGLFIWIIVVIKRMNPSVILIENSKPFLKSETFSIFKRELAGDYLFEETTVRGDLYGDFEPRERSCVIARDKSLPESYIADLHPPVNVSHRKLSDILEPITPDDKRWRKMEHVKKKINDKRLNFRNTVYTPDDTRIGSLMATYASTKVGAPFLIHPSESEYQRHFTYVEHGRIRRAPDSLMTVMDKVANGLHSLVRKTGSISAIHRMYGNSVSPLPWHAAGKSIGIWLTSLKELLCDFYKCNGTC